MSLRASAFLQERALRRAQPLSALLELTYACNWRCVFCYNPRHHDKRRLDGDEWRVVIDDLRELGTLNVTLTGGEPLTHPQAFEVMADRPHLMSSCAQHIGQDDACNAAPSS